MKANTPEKLWEFVDVSAGPSACWPWTGTRDAAGYGRFSIRCKYYSAHRLAYVQRLGEIPEGLEIMHSCDNPPCCNPAHLSPGTRTDNMQDMLAKGRGRKPLGSEHGRSKLTEAQVLEMRFLRESENLTYVELSRRFGVSFSMVQQIINRKAWKHI
jgi:hypothetical protein